MDNFWTAIIEATRLAKDPDFAEAMHEASKQLATQVDTLQQLDETALAERLEALRKDRAEREWRELEAWTAQAVATRADSPIYQRVLNCDPMTAAGAQQAAEEIREYQGITPDTTYTYSHSPSPFTQADTTDQALKQFAACAEVTVHEFREHIRRVADAPENTTPPVASITCPTCHTALDERDRRADGRIKCWRGCPSGEM